MFHFLQVITNQLLQQGLIAEEFGGDIQVIPISATQRMGIDQLEEGGLMGDFIEKMV